eukprot:1294331-Pleurochrysis_carterae.AAC.2
MKTKTGPDEAKTKIVSQSFWRPAKCGCSRTAAASVPQLRAVGVGAGVAAARGGVVRRLSSLFKVLYIQLPCRVKNIDSRRSDDA